jgi:hypothetical protein
METYNGHSNEVILSAHFGTLASRIFRNQKRLTFEDSTGVETSKGKSTIMRPKPLDELTSARCMLERPVVVL